MKLSSCLFFIGTLAILAELSVSVEIRISPSCSYRRASPCQRLAGISISATPDATLTFTPGNHQITNNMNFYDFKYLEFKGSGINISTITCTNDEIKISYSTTVKVSGLTFSHCKLSFISTTNIDLRNTVFLRSTSTGSLGFQDCSNVNVDQSYFNNKNYAISKPIVSFASVSGFRFTKSEIANVGGSLYSSAISLTYSFGFLGYSRFHNISAKYAIYLNYGSSLYISNSTFINDIASSIILLYSAFDKIVIVSSNFENCRCRSSGAIIHASTSTSITALACKFTEVRGILVRPSVAAATVDCNVPPFRIPMHSNLNLCKRHTLAAAATYNNFSSSLTTLTPPEVDISLEASEYTAFSEIGRSYRALQICAIARDILFPVEASFTVINGSAVENVDFTMGLLKCQSITFQRKTGIQKECAFIRIIEDSIDDENSKHFSVSFKAARPYVISGISTATVTIMKTITSATIPTTLTPPTMMVTAETQADENTNSSFHIAVVECGPLRRMVNYSREGDNIENLKSAIVQSFGELTGLEASHIALLQVKSNIYREYVDIVSGYPAISNYSLVKVITYNGFLCAPKMAEAVPSEGKN